MPTRRQALIGIGGALTGITSATLLTSQPSSAASVSANFEAQNKTAKVSQDVKRVDLVADGSLSYETSVVPDDLVLRLEASRNGTNFTQLDFIEQTDLRKEYTTDYNLVGNVLDLGLVSHDNINPVEVGNTKSLDLSVRVILEVSKDGRVIHEDRASDSLSIEIERTTAEVTSEIGGTVSAKVVT